MSGDVWRSGFFFAVALVSCGCATARPLTDADARDLATHPFDGSADDVLDAVWLALEAQGYVATAADRRTGTLAVSRPDGHGYDVQVSAKDDEQLVRAVPKSPRPLVLGGPDGQDAKWDALWQATWALLDTWRAPPGWTFDTKTNSLWVPGFSFEPPAAWEYLDFDLEHRRSRVVRHRKRTRGALTPTLLAVVAHRRPQPTLPGFLQEAAGVALSARTRLTLPDDLEARPEPGRTLGGVLRVLDGATAREVRWHAQVAHDAAWTVTLVVACGEEEAACEHEWREVLSSVVAPGFAARRP